jgi:hypothetical protein
MGQTTPTTNFTPFGVSAESFGAESFGAEGKCQSMETGKYGNHKWMGGPVKENSLTNDYETVYGNFGIYCDKCEQEAYVSFDIPAEDFIEMCQSPYSHEFKDFDLRGAESFGAEKAHSYQDNCVDCGRFTRDSCDECGNYCCNYECVAGVFNNDGSYHGEASGNVVRMCKGCRDEWYAAESYGAESPIPTRIEATQTQRGVVQAYDAIPAGDGHVVGQFTPDMDYAPSGMYAESHIADSIQHGFGAVLGVLGGLIVAGSAMNAVSRLSQREDN